MKTELGRAVRAARALGTLLATLLFLLGSARRASAQDEDVAQQRPATFEWDPLKKLLYLNLSYRDIVDDKIQDKLRRGLPTTIVLTATVFRAGTPDALSTTAQSCKVTWHVWEEAYRVELMRPGGSQVRWTTTVEGVLRRCAEARRLIAGDAGQIPMRTALYARGKIQVNPISPEVLRRIQRWVMRPSATGTATPGDALFSTFTGLFLQRIGEAESELKFSTRAMLPQLVAPAPDSR